MSDTWTDEDDEMLAAEANTMAGPWARLAVDMRAVQIEFRRAVRQSVASFRKGWERGRRGLPD